MKLIQSRIQKVNRLLSDFDENDSFLIGVNIDEEIESILKEILNIDSVEMYTRIFPEPGLGIMSRRNSVGEEIIDKTKPEEPYYHPFSWNFTYPNGNTSSGSSYRLGYRAHRDFIDPKELKILITEKENEEQIVVVDYTYENKESHYQEIKFAANLLLEIFGQVETFKVEDNSMITDSTTIQTVNWELLPSGERIWEAFDRGVTANITETESILMQERFDLIENYEPTKAYRGLGGYVDYIVFEFEDINTYIVESIIYGNATYILKNDWERVSKLTKKEIIQGDLAEDRIVHNKSWETKIVNYLPKKMS